MTDTSGRNDAPRDVTVGGARLVRRLFGNYLFQTMNLGVRFVDQLLLIPLFMFAWGIDLYHDWLVITAGIFLLSWCTFGIDDYFGNLFLRLASIGDWAELRRQMHIALFVATLISLALGATLYGALLILPLAGVLKLSAMGESTAILILVIMAPTWMGYPISVLHSVYRAYGEFSRGECISGIYYVIQLGAVIALLALRQPPVALALCYATMSVLSALVVAIDVCRRYPAVSLGWALPTRSELRRLVPQSLLYFTSPLSVALTQNATLLIFGLFDVGAGAVVAFNVLRVLTGLTRQLGVQSLVIGSGIEMARLHVQQNRQACESLYAHTSRIAGCFAGVLCGLTVPFSTPFVRLWTHGAVTADLVLVVCFLAGILLSAPGRASLSLLRYTNHGHAIALSSCAYSIGGLLLSLALVGRLDGVGIALAFAITETLAIGIYPPLMVGKLFGFPAARQLGQSYLAAGGGFLLSYAVARILFTADLGAVALGLRLAIWAAVVGPFCVALLVPRAHRARCAAALRRFLAPRWLGNSS